MNTEQQVPTRRGFLDWIIGFCSFVTGLAMTLPGVMYLWPAARGGSPANVEAEGAQDLSPGQSMMIQINSQAAILVRGRSGFKAYSAVCTHLGCLVKWDAAQRKFLCPCHAAEFNEDGGVLSGPPPSPLVKLTVKEVGGKVFVSA